MRTHEDQEETDEEDQEEIKDQEDKEEDTISIDINYNTKRSMYDSDNTPTMTPM